MNVSIHSAGLASRQLLSSMKFRPGHLFDSHQIYLDCRDSPREYKDRNPGPIRQFSRAEVGEERARILQNSTWKSQYT
jgi:hypothetical protein